MPRNQRRKVNIFKEFPDIEIEDIRSGGQKAFTIIFDFYYEPLYGYVLSLVRADDDTVDKIVADTMLKMWMKRADFANLSHLRHWVITVSRNGAYTWLQNHGKTIYPERMPEMPENEDGFEQEFEANVQDLIKASMKLSSLEKDIITKRYYEGKTRKEIASDLNITPNHAGVLLNRIVQKISKYFKSGR